MKNQAKFTAILMLFITITFNACNGVVNTSTPPNQVINTSSKAITAFNFTTPASTGIVTEATHTIDITVPFGTVITGLVPSITHTGASINPVSNIANDFTSSQIYTVTAIDASTQDYTVNVTVALNSAKAITAFTFPSSASTTITEATHTISVIVPSGTDITALIPSITHTGAIISPASGVAHNFTSSQTYTVTAADSSIQAYTVTVSVVLLPTVTTTAITGNLAFTSYISGTSARGGGNVTSGGGSSVTDRGLCWNTTGNPTISDSKVSDGTPTGTGLFINSNLTGLTADTTYYVRAYATNSGGTSYGAEVSFNSGKSFGTNYAGGYVFYNDGNAHGLVSAINDQSTFKIWISGGSTQTTTNGNTSTAIGTGQSNTNMIIAQIDHLDSAAKVCNDYSDGTYSDWFLPSKDELNLMFLKLKSNGIGGFGSNCYWSSSEVDSSHAWYQAFYIGLQPTSTKHISYNVRSIRAF